ncbi:type II toxin-antitoxin system death-on-curing family toxin [Luteimonas gilva]|uniref:Type II toxin-antitoxin system death-on-curing family toxin n=1 Tax=Luteimonas gilva TaxID=2572684 RepID=A0A4U5JW12_9GAMM|nr:type II toxin-antitoxin system death-on-curing family toxin [Luteimonas gilva]TKR30639.1 type II toxin-antitoxin system death-on-curing family toxin [Luteimonas gilva]
MNEPVWLETALIVAVHEYQLAEHGGAVGVRDEGLLASALARPQQLWSYGEPPPDMATLAAAYGFGIARNHPFVDGNKRSALVAMETFLNINGWQLTASNVECVRELLALAAGDVGETELADWLRAHLARSE